MKTLSEVFTESGNIRGEFIDTDMEDKLHEYHRRAAEAALAMSNGKLPIGIRQALKLQLTTNQISHRYPWMVVVVHKGKRYRKKCMNLGAAVSLWSKYKERDYNVTIVSRSRGYDIPAELRGRLPKGWLWCPHCMKPRKFRAAIGQEFHGLRKKWSDKKRKYEWIDRRLQLLRCPVCECTNRDNVFRRSNQPWEVRRIKRGARRVKRRHKTQRRGFEVSVVPVKKKRKR